MSLETSDTPEAGADEAPLAFDDAVSLLSEADAAPDGDDLPEDVEEDEAEEEHAGDQPEGEDDAPEDDPASEEDAENEDDEPDAPAIDAPKFWSAEEKALFAKAPPEVQQLVAQKDAEAEKRVYAAKEEAAQARKDASVIGELAKVTDQLIQHAAQTFKGKWDGVDWLQLAQDDPANYNVLKEMFSTEQAELQRLQTAKAATEAEEHRQFLIAEGAKLRDAGHPITDPVKGPEEKKAVIAYADANGFTDADLKWAGARELTILHKAMLYDRLQQTARTPAPKPKPEPRAKAPATLKPSAPPQPRRETATRQKRETIGRAMKTGRMDDAVAAVLAMEGT
jgi:hypothetical protein